MKTQNRASNNNHVPIVWYKVPILWLMFTLLGMTVLAGITMFIMARNTQDTVVLENNLTPLSKKLALPQKQNPSIPNTN